MLDRGQLAVGDVVELTPTVDHSRCHVGTCTPGVICPRCASTTLVGATKGRWDAERRATALPYEPVWVRLGCGCEFGDESLARPS